MDHTDEEIRLDSSLNGCTTLESTITVLIKGNADKRAELKNLQTQITESAQTYLDKLVEREQKLRLDLHKLILKKGELELEAKQFAETNDKLAELVALAQRTDQVKGDMSGHRDEYYMSTAETIQDFEQNRIDYVKLTSNIEELVGSLVSDSENVNKLLEENQELVIKLHKNYDVIRLLEQQNKYAEQQFDLILNQLPWEPLADSYLNQLEESGDTTLRNLAVGLRIQSNEISDLNESMNCKTERKMRVLEELSQELDSFLRKRSEANLMEFRC